MTQEFKYLGKRTTQPTKQLDTFPAPPNVHMVTLDAQELTSFCPVTGQPDFSSVLIVYEPHELCIETKSLKLYLWSFRDEEIFGENLASQMAEDIFRAINPMWVEVELRQGVRGGIQLTARANKKQLP
jgi:7-cyano-7-deazaguanine reductase